MKKWLISASIIGCFAGLTPVVLAGECLRQSGPINYATQANTQSAAYDPDFRPGQPAHHWDVRSSVQISRDVLKEAYLASRDAYTAKLQKYAKCSPREAEKAVVSAHPGMKVSNMQLRNIRTSLVYVGVAEDDEDRYLVVVDAGNGKVLLDRKLSTHHEKVFADKDS